jgi:hypothetical protein
MTQTLVHLDPEQARTERRKLLFDDVYILLSDFLRHKHKEGQTTLTHVECFLSARRLAATLLSLPNVLEGIDDELDDLAGEAEEEEDAMLVGMVASFIILAVSKGGKDFDAWPINSRILSRWSDHPFYVPLLNAALHKEEERWMQGKRMNLLRYELREMEGEECGHVTQFMTDIAGMAVQAGASTVKEVLLVFNRYNADHGYRYQQPIDMLYAKLDGLARQQVHIERVNDIHGNGKVNIGN